MRPGHSSATISWAAKKHARLRPLNHPSFTACTIRSGSNGQIKFSRCVTSSAGAAGGGVSGRGVSACLMKGIGPWYRSGTGLPFAISSYVFRSRLQRPVLSNSDKEEKQWVHARKNKKVVCCDIFDDKRETLYFHTIHGSCPSLDDAKGALACCICNDKDSPILAHFFPGNLRIILLDEFIQRLLKLDLGA